MGGISQTDGRPEESVMKIAGLQMHLATEWRWQVAHDEPAVGKKRDQEVYRQSRVPTSKTCQVTIFRHLEPGA